MTRQHGLGEIVANSGRARVALWILGGLIAVAVVGPWFTCDPADYVAAPHQPPSLAHWLGTTGQGQDVLAQTVAGTRASLASGLCVGFVVVFVGALVGLTAAFAGGAVDTLLSLLVNVLLVVPSLPLAILCATWLPPGPWTVALVLVATGWAWNARVVRVQGLTLRRRDYIVAAQVVGEPMWRIVLVEMLPNLGPVLLGQFIGATTYAIGAQVGLEFLGLGDVGHVTWGSNLYWASNDQALLTGAWWTFVPTGGCIALVGLALSLLQGAMDEATNPALRAERSWRQWLRKRGASVEHITPVVPS